MALADQIIGAESGGSPTARNARSSAGGAGQFIDSTWLSMLSKYRPDLAQLPREQQLALKDDPALSRAMTGAYAQENAAYLRARGHSDTPGNTYLAHFAGPQGADKVLSADPQKKAVDILDPAAAQANPFLANMTAGDLRAWADRKMGVPRPPLPIPMPQQAAPQNPQGGALALFSPPATPQPPAPQNAPAGAPQAAGQAPSPSIWSMMGLGGGQAPNLPLFAPQQGQPGDPSSLAGWWNRQTTMTG